MLMYICIWYYFNFLNEIFTTYFCQIFLIYLCNEENFLVRIWPNNSSRLFVHSCTKVEVVAYGGNETDRFISVHRLEFRPDISTFAHTVFHHSYNSLIKLNSLLYTPLSDGYYTPTQCVGYFAWSSPDWLCRGAVAAIPQMCSDESLYRQHSVMLIFIRMWNLVVIGIREPFQM